MKNEKIETIKLQKGRKKDRKKERELTNTWRRKLAHAKQYAITIIELSSLWVHGCLTSSLDRCNDIVIF